MDTLSFSRLHEAGDDTVGLEPLFGSRSETHLAEDDHLAQRLLGMVVCRGHPWDTEKSEEVSLLRADEIPSQGFSRLEAKLLVADVFEFLEELVLQARG